MTDFLHQHMLQVSTLTVLSFVEISAQKLNRADHSDVVYPEDGEEGSDRAQIVIPAAYLSSRDASGEKFE